VERIECDGFKKEFAGARIGQIVTVFWNRLLERGESSV